MMAKTNGEDSQNLSNTCKEDKAVLQAELPEDIIRQILPLIPTKSAFRISLLANQFEGAWCSGPEIELDEGNTDGGVNFTNVLKRYLKFRTESKDLHLDQSMDLFRVRMAMDDPVRGDILEKLLIGFAKERSIKVLDLSCLTKPRLLSFKILLHINSLTCLNLESVRIKGCSSDLLLPFLKTMSLKSMQLPYDNFSDMLIARCPSIEKLSVTSCSFDLESQQYSLSIPCCTLNSLEFRDCNFRKIYVYSCPNLEYFTSVSESPDLKCLKLFKCNSLKNIEILEKHLESIEILFDSRANGVKINVDTSNLTRFTLNSKDMRHKCIDGQGSFTHYSDYYYALEEFKKMGIDPSSLFR